MVKYLRCKMLLAVVGILFHVPLQAMEVAITVDDLPTNGNLPLSETRAEVANKMLTVFKKHHIAGIYGLVNGYNVKATSDLVILKSWMNAGNYIGNHTFDHLDLAKVSSQQYIENIAKNEFILLRLMQNQDYHYFRYPYLSEGNTQEKRDAVRQYLFKNSYKIAPVTVDFFEYEWNDPYVRCSSKNDSQSIEWLKQTYIEQANNALIISHELSMMLFNREIKNVLLIHMNAFTSDMLDALLTSYENKGVKFISLPDALKDEVYQINPNMVRNRAYTFLNQVRLTRGLSNPDSVNQLYDSLPEDKLNAICR